MASATSPAGSSGSSTHSHSSLPPAAVRLLNLSAIYLGLQREPLISLDSLAAHLMRSDKNTFHSLPNSIKFTQLFRLQTDRFSLTTQGAALKVGLASRLPASNHAPPVTAGTSRSQSYAVTATSPSDPAAVTAAVAATAAAASDPVSAPLAVAAAHSSTTTTNATTRPLRGQLNDPYVSDSVLMSHSRNAAQPMPSKQQAAVNAAKAACAQQAAHAAREAAAEAWKDCLLQQVISFLQKQPSRHAPLPQLLSHLREMHENLQAEKKTKRQRRRPPSAADINSLISQHPERFVVLSGGGAGCGVEEGDEAVVVKLQPPGAPKEKSKEGRRDARLPGASYKASPTKLGMQAAPSRRI